MALMVLVMPLKPAAASEWPWWLFPVTTSRGISRPRAKQDRTEPTSIGSPKAVPPQLCGFVRVCAGCCLQNGCALLEHLHKWVHTLPSASNYYEMHLWKSKCLQTCCVLNIKITTIWCVKLSVVSDQKSLKNRPSRNSTTKNGTWLVHQDAGWWSFSFCKTSESSHFSVPTCANCSQQLRLCRDSRWPTPPQAQCSPSGGRIWCTAAGRAHWEPRPLVLPGKAIENLNKHQLFNRKLIYNIFNTV